MTGEEKGRAKLDFGDIDEPTTPKVPKVDPSAVRAATQAAGFRDTPRSARSQAAPAPVPAPVSHAMPAERPLLRRTRRKTGRTEPFQTRIRADTLQSIYDYVDEQDITLAEFLERAVVALQGQSKK